MPWLPVASAAGAPDEVLRVATTRFHQLFRGPTQPAGFPASIETGLASTIPNVQRAAIDELRAYIRSCFFLDFENYFLITNLVTAGIICLLIIIGIPVVLHRLYHGRLHVFRLERRMQGSYIIPNAINCFLLLEGLYGILTVAFNLSVWKLFHDHTVVWLKLFQAFRSLIWIPLYIGAFLTGWGSFYTAPGALDKPTASRHKTSAKGHLPWPMIVNLSCLGTPVVLIISLIPPVSLSCVRMVSAFNRYEAWNRSLQALLAATPVGTLVGQTAVTEYQNEAFSIFTEWTRSYYYVDIAYVMWGFWALLFLVFYVPAGGVLVYLLYRQVNRQKSILLSYQRKLEIQMAQEGRQTQVSVLTSEPAAQHPNRPSPEKAGEPSSKAVWSAANPTSRLGAPLENIYEDRGASDGSQGTGHSGATVSFKGSHELVGLESALRQDPPASHPVFGALTPGLASRTGHVASLADEGENSSTAGGPGTNSSPVTPTTPKAPSAFRKLMRMETSTSSNRAGAPSHKSQRRKRISITGGPMSRYKYLRRCLVNLLILYFGIISAACFFGAITIYLAAVEYEHALQGPAAVAHSIAIAGSTAAWVSAVFGVLTIGSIIFRNFDNPQPEASQNSGEGGGMRRRFNRNASRTNHSGSEGAEQAQEARGAHEKTRTLPAVPESVDLEASMMSMVRSRPHMAMNTSMKFEHSELPGGFVIRPDDHLASTYSVGHTPEMEEAGRTGYYDPASRPGKTKAMPLRPPPASRAWLSREREATASVPQDVTESFGLTSLPMVAMNSDIGRSRQGSVERESSEDAAGHFRTNDTTLAEYPSFDPRVLKGTRETVPQMAPAPTARNTRTTEVTPTSPVLKRQSRLSDSVGSETPASRIAREWAQSQYLATPLPETPTMGERSLDANTFGSRTGDGAWIDELEGSPPSSPNGTPVRPARDLRRLQRFFF